MYSGALPALSGSSQISSVQSKAHASKLQSITIYLLLLLTITTSTSTRMHETPCCNFSQPGAIYWWTVQLPNYINLSISIVYHNETTCTHLSRTPSCDFSQLDAIWWWTSLGGHILTLPPSQEVERPYFTLPPSQGVGAEGGEDPMSVIFPTWIVLWRPSRHRRQERRDLRLKVPSEALRNEK